MARPPSPRANRPRLLVVVGTRPEAIKLAPVVRSLRGPWGEQCEVVLCASGQHRELLDEALDLFGLRPEVDLDVMRPGQSPGQVAARVLDGLTPLLAEASWRWVVVQGDTTTATAAALAAFYAHVPVAHVEAGLRSHRMDEPFPEELNRRVVALASTVHFAPTPSARANLLAEGVPEPAIVVTGNTVVDALHEVLSRPVRPQVSALLDSLGLAVSPPPEARVRRQVLVTIHRRESLDEHLPEICGAIATAADASRGRLRFIVAAHPNPQIGPRMRDAFGSCPGVEVTKALPYDAFVRALSRCDFALTDSGGVQEESAALGKPVLVVRDVTERVEGVRDGVSWMVGRSRPAIVSALLQMASDGERCRAMSRSSLAYGDGRAAERIAARLLAGESRPLPAGLPALTRSRPAARSAAARREAAALRRVLARPAGTPPAVASLAPSRRSRTP